MFGIISSTLLIFSLLGYYMKGGLLFAVGKRCHIKERALRAATKGPRLFFMQNIWHEVQIWSIGKKMKNSHDNKMCIKVEIAVGPLFKLA